MRALELKIPPPVLAVLIAAVMWGMCAPLIESPGLVRIAAAATLALCGLGFMLAGVLAFRRMGTTVNPMKPETTSALACSGVYRVTRNPMYLGLAFILVAWAVYLSSVWALLGPLALVLYLNRFQIAPEENALSAKFGSAYSAYRSRVRRWL